jgi:hypothetical protein
MRDRSCARPSETSLSAHCLSDRGRRPRFCCWIYRPNKYHARGQAGAATWHFYHRPRWLRLRLRCGFLLDAVRTADGSIRYEGRTSSRTAACFGPSPRAKSTAVQRSECIYKPGGTPRGLFQCFLALLHPGGVEAPPQPTLRPGLPNPGGYAPCQVGDSPPAGPANAEDPAPNPLPRANALGIAKTENIKTPKAAVAIKLDRM